MPRVRIQFLSVSFGSSSLLLPSPPPSRSFVRACSFFLLLLQPRKTQGRHSWVAAIIIIARGFERSIDDLGFATARSRRSLLFLALERDFYHPARPKRSTVFQMEKGTRREVCVYIYTHIYTYIYREFCI